MSWFEVRISSGSRSRLLTRAAWLRWDERLAEVLRLLVFVLQLLLPFLLFLALARTAKADEAIAVEVPEGQWPLAAGNHANTRYSSLGEINLANVKDLAVVFRYPTGATRRHEAAPIVAAGMMYIVTPYPNVVHALDLAQPGGPPKWTFDPAADAASQGVACCDVVNRGAAVANGRLFFNTLDNQTIALDARSGRELWRTRLGGIDIGETMTMAPLVIGELVLHRSWGFRRSRTSSSVAW